jgi:DNA repair exonuclease SbcCD ATPase subunit
MNMFKIKNLTVKNFMSVGNATQGIDFDRNDLTLVLGENLDLGGDDSGARNGTGKTTIINALSYSLFGQALTNIKKDNLINKTNSKHMLVTIDFESEGRYYRIERGRKPNVLKFYVDNEELETKDDNSQGDSRETQLEIERLLNMSHDMFKHIVALNTYTEPFLSLKANDQRTIIEQLLGITVLSEKAEALKEQNKSTKEAIQQEEFRIKAVGDANKRIQDQIDALIRRQTLWTNKHKDDIASLQAAYDQLAKLDIESELDAHKKLAEYNTKSKQIADLKTLVKRCEQDEARETKEIEKLKKEIVALENHTCHSCGQSFHDAKQVIVLEEKQKTLQETALQALSTNTQLLENQEALGLLGDLGQKPVIFYKDESDAFEHRSSMASVLTQLNSKQLEQDPYTDQINDMKETAVEEINYDFMNSLVRIKDHQDFLLKLLTNKDSFIRKKIIDQNLSYLNARLGFYLDKIGLPHTVKFNNDLSVSIEELGRELDFDNLSRGERNRLILSLSWSFRDVWESLYQPINLLFIDELVDSGMDSSGVENSLAILKKMSREGNKSVWLVSHKDELAGRVNNILTVVKENGFTNYNTDVEIV